MLQISLDKERFSTQKEYLAAVKLITKTAEQWETQSDALQIYECKMHMLQEKQMHLDMECISVQKDYLAVVKIYHAKKKINA